MNKKKQKQLNQILEQKLNPFTISFTISLIVILLSFTEIFQVLEWAVFDQFFRLRWQNRTEDKVVIVTIDEQDLSNVSQWPISDLTLTKLLKQIKQQNPRVIGLDIFRDLPVNPGHQQLVSLMKSTPNLIGIEKVSGDKVPPPPTLAKLEQVAAADLISDSDGKIRRALLSIKPENKPTKLGLGTALALRYLSQEDIQLQIIDDKKNIYKLGNATFLPLKKNHGAYINANVGGYQIMLNYLGKSCLFAQPCPFKTISMTDVLAGDIDSELMKDKIVLIGVIARSSSDFFYNPYSYSDNTSISGVEIHAHITSMILNAGLGNDYLIKSIPEYLEWLWLLSWATLGSFLSAKWVENKNNGFFILKLTFSLILITYILFLFNWWIPLVTPLIALVTADTTSLIYTLWRKLKTSYRQLEKYASSLEDIVEEKTQDLRVKQIQLEDKNLELESQNFKLAEATKIAENANEAKSRFLANMSHELRTPLNAIIGFSQLMDKDTLLDKNQKEFVGIINRSGEHLLSLINDILDISKIEANKITINEEVFDFLEMLKTVHEMLAIKAQGKNIILTFDVDPIVPQHISSDQQKLRQILINLLNNAIKFTNEGKVKLRVKLLQDSNFLKKKSEYRQIIFKVKDTGKGIKQEELPKLFKPFEQTQTGKNSNEGTGLGLTISRKFINLLGGDIEVKSKVDIGTTFTFDIKVKSIESEQVAPETKRIVKGVDIREGEITPKILIVDDVQENCLLLENILAPLDLPCRTAYNGKESIDIWQVWQPDLIFMDIQMPIMNGYKAVELIRQQEKQLLRDQKRTTPMKIVAVTASIFDEEADNILQCGFDDLIRKPFTENTILQKLENHLGLKYIYENQEPQTNTEMASSFNLRELLEQEILITEGQKMSASWCDDVIQSANKGSDDELLDLIAQIPDDLIALPEMLSHLTHEFLFEEIIRLIFRIQEST